MQRDALSPGFRRSCLAACWVQTCSRVPCPWPGLRLPRPVLPPLKASGPWFPLQLKGARLTAGSVRLARKCPLRRGWQVRGEPLLLLSLEGLHALGLQVLVSDLLLDKELLVDRGLRSCLRAWLACWQVLAHCFITFSNKWKACNLGNTYTCWKIIKKPCILSDQ